MRDVQRNQVVYYLRNLFFFTVDDAYEYIGQGGEKNKPRCYQHISAEVIFEEGCFTRRFLIFQHDISLMVESKVSIDQTTSFFAGEGREV